MQIIIDYLCHVFNTIFGLYQRPFLKKWDLMLNEIIDIGYIKTFNKSSITFDYYGTTYQVWTKDKWCSYGYLCCVDGKLVCEVQQFRPRFRTMRRLNNLHIRLLDAEREDIGFVW